MRQVTKLAWAAGFLDGEGCFRNHNGANINAAQVQKQPLTELHNMFGGKMRLLIRPNPNHNNVWIWDLFGAHAASVMMTLYPFMSPKRQVSIRKALHKWKRQPGRQRHASIRPRNPDGSFV